eukprot:Platyproteum_vivax@DN16876_c0_g1_i1.p1
MALQAATSQPVVLHTAGEESITSPKMSAANTPVKSTPKTKTKKKKKATKSCVFESTPIVSRADFSSNHAADNGPVSTACVYESVPKESTADLKYFERNKNVDGAALYENDPNAPNTLRHPDGEG